MMKKTTYGVNVYPSITVQETDPGTGRGDDRDKTWTEDLPPILLFGPDLADLSETVRRELYARYSLPCPPAQPKDDPRGKVSAPFVAGIAAAALLVGAVLGGVLSRTDEKEVEVLAPVSCVTAMSTADSLIAAYGDGYRAMMMTQTAARTKGLRASADEVNRLTPLYTAENQKCREAR